MSAECSICRSVISPFARKCPYCQTDFRFDEGYVIGGANYSSDVDQLLEVLVTPGLYLLVLLIPLCLLLDYFDVPFWLGTIITLILGCVLLINRKKLPDF